MSQWNHQEDKPASAKRDRSNEQDKRSTRYQKEQTVEGKHCSLQQSSKEVKKISKQHGSNPEGKQCFMFYRPRQKICYQKRAVKHWDMKGTAEFIQNQHINKPRPHLQHSPKASANITFKRTFWPWISEHTKGRFVLSSFMGSASRRSRSRLRVRSPPEFWSTCTHRYPG